MCLIVVSLNLGEKWYIGVGAYLSAVVIVLVAVGLSLRLAWRLYCASRRPITTEQAASGQVDAAQLSRQAPANRLIIGPERARRLQDSTSNDTRDTTGRALEAAGEMFLFNWSKCQADVTAIGRASALIFLLSIIVPAVSMKCIYESYARGSRRTDIECLSLTVMKVSTQLGVGWFVSAALSGMFCIFARALVQRKDSWEAFSGIVRTEIQYQEKETGGQHQ